MSDNPYIRAFSSFEEAQDFLRRSEDAANERITDEQQGVGYGDTWIRFLNVADRVVIFGRVQTIDEITATERHLGAPDAEVAYTISHISGMEARNYVWGDCYSILERRGELGSTHRSQLWPCPPDLFEAARLCSWEIDHLAPHHKAQLQDIYNDWRQKYLKLPR